MGYETIGEEDVRGRDEEDGQWGELEEFGAKQKIGMTASAHEAQATQPTSEASIQQEYVRTCAKNNARVGETSVGSDSGVRRPSLVGGQA